MKNPLFQVISPTTALVTNSSHIICYVLEHINSSLCSPASRMGRQNSRRDSRSWRPPSVAVGATCFARASGEQAHESAAGKLSH